MWFQIDLGISDALLQAAKISGIDCEKFSPDVRPSDPKFGDFQANGVISYAKSNHLNPRKLADQIVGNLQTLPNFSKNIQITIAGPGFINFRLSNSFLTDWLNNYKSVEKHLSDSVQGLGKKTIVIDFSSPNTAKQMHVGHLRSMNIGNSICRLLQFCGSNVIRDNHIGDWGTQFGILIMVLKRKNLNCVGLSISDIENAYQEGNEIIQCDHSAMAIARNELVKLQNGDSENLKIWQAINEISQVSFDEIYRDMGIEFDYSFGESFYRDKVARVYNELINAGIAREDDGALCVFFDQNSKFSKQPFIIRKSDGASNYAATDLATVLYRTENFQSEEIIYVTDARQQDHFQQLFLTVERWYLAYGRKCPKMRHVTFGTILGEDGKAIKTRSGDPVKLKDLMRESNWRAYQIINEKSKDLSDAEKIDIAKVLGINSIKYADLLSNRTNDYIFCWDKMLTFDGNTAAYLLYAIARIKSIFRKVSSELDEKIDLSDITIGAIETAEEREVVCKLTYSPSILIQAICDLRPHYICTYLFELTTTYSAFYNTNRVIGERRDVLLRRLAISMFVLQVLEICMSLLGLKTLDKM